MHRRMNLAVAALMLATPALAPALADDVCRPSGAETSCAPFLDAYRTGQVPGETSDVTREQFVLEQPQELTGDSQPDRPYGDDVIYWDGESAMIVPEESGPRLEIADW